MTHVTRYEPRVDRVVYTARHMAALLRRESIQRPPLPGARCLVHILPLSPSVALVTKHLRLRELAPRDAADLADLDARLDVTSYAEVRAVRPSNPHRFLAELAAERGTPGRPRRVLGITVPPDEHLIGTCWLLRRAAWPDYLSAQLGYELAPAYRGNGYAAETAHALLAHAFGSLGLRRVWARVRVDDSAACQALEAAGMRREVHVSYGEVAPGERRDVVLYAARADGFSLGVRTA